MVSAIISRLVILLFGTLYPAYASYKAVKTKNVKEYVKWMMYWIVFALFTCVETIADIFIAWLPFYYELKILFVLWLLSPATKGSSILYRKFIHPQLAKREKEIDSYISKASDQGYSAILSLGSRGLNYATNIVLTTAIKGQSKIADHLKKSYSLNDLSGDSPDGSFRREESIPLDEQEEERVNATEPASQDNRLIEESFQQEMQEKELQEEDKMRKRRTLSKESELNPVEEENVDPEGEKIEKSKKITYSHKEELSTSLAKAYSHSGPSSPSTPPVITIPGYTPFSRYSGSSVHERSNSLPSASASWRSRSSYTSSKMSHK